MIFNSSGGMFEKNLIMGICLYNDILIIFHSLMCIQTICVIYIIIYIYIYIISTYYFFKNISYKLLRIKIYFVLVIHHLEI